MWYTVVGVCIELVAAVCYVDADEFGEEFVTSVKNKAVSTYIPCNARASNAYSNKTVMVHAYNRYPLLSVSKYLDAHNVVYSSEVFALNELLQWLWRSTIRNRAYPCSYFV